MLILARASGPAIDERIPVCPKSKRPCTFKHFQWSLLFSTVSGTADVSQISFNGVAQVPVPAPKKFSICKNGGWKTLTNPSFRNQGTCVSYYAHLAKLQHDAEKARPHVDHGKHQG